MQNSKSNIRKAVIASAILLSISASAQADVVLSGFLNAGSPSSFNSADLQNYAASHAGAVSTVTVNGEVYTGVSLYSYLKTYLATDPTVPKNDILRDYVQASGASGSTVYALGNLLGSGFGVQNDIIAYSDSNGTLATPSLIAGDGANVTNLTSLNIGHVSYAGATPSFVPTSFVVNGNVGNPTTYDASNLPNSLPTQVVTVATPPLTGQSFTGVKLWDLLVQSGMPTDTNTLLNSYLIASGADGYQAIYGLEEIMPQYGNQNDLVAYATGTGASLGAAGIARTVVPTDLRGGRYMSTMTALTVVSLPVTAVPVPASALLMLSGLLTIACNSWRKRLSA